MISIIIGTRPEAIKMAPVILECRKRDINHRVITTGQHKELLHDALDMFNIAPDIDIGVMTHDQTPVDVIAAALPALYSYITDVHSTTVVLAQGDTTTVLAAAMAAFHARVPFGHVEAGLRTHDMSQPFPEEYNRRAASIGATWNFAPTEMAVSNLIHEGVPPHTIFNVGNTVVDAVNYILERYPPLRTARKYALVTCHRRENRGDNMANIFSAVNDAALAMPGMEFIAPLHPSPAVQQAARKYLIADNISKREAVSYVECLHLIDGAEFVLTDSGGIQEEAATLGVPTGVLREVTERPEGIAAGICELLGSNRAAIYDWAVNPKIDTSPVNVYGDGTSAVQIVDRITL